MDRLLNYTFALFLIYIFALWAPASMHSAIITGVVASFLFCTAAFIFGWLTLDGAAAAMVVGTVSFGLGGWPTVIVVICFFLSGTLLSIEDTEQPSNTGAAADRGERRNGLQVWANGFWLVFWLMAGILTNLFVCWMAAMAVMATATADTWATELGSRRFNTATYLVTSFKEVSAGTDGGISWPGLAAALCGSLFIGIIAAFGFSLSAGWIVLIIFSGFAGSLADSYLGAKLQHSTQHLTFSRFSWHKKVTIDNNMVNWIATGLGSVMLLILNQVFL